MRLLPVLLFCASLFRVEAAEAPLTVRVVYLVSADREENPKYTAAVEHAIRDIRRWYGGQLGGPTFRLSDPVVEVVRSREDADWFYANPNGRQSDNWGFNNSLQEARRLLGAKFDDPNHVWVIYSDGPGDKGRGGNGVTCLPENDLLGLVGKHPTQKNKLRWIAGLGHEIGHAFGHAFGLPHPADTKKDADAIMWTGIYGKYPDKTYLTDLDKKILMRSPFFFHADGKPVFRKGAVVNRFKYAGGSFDQLAGKSPSYWHETKDNGGKGIRVRGNPPRREVRRDPRHHPQVHHPLARRGRALPALTKRRQDLATPLRRGPAVPGGRRPVNPRNSDPSAVQS